MKVLANVTGCVFYSGLLGFKMLLVLICACGILLSTKGENSSLKGLNKGFIDEIRSETMIFNKGSCPVSRVQDLEWS